MPAAETTTAQPDQLALPAPRERRRADAIAGRSAGVRRAALLTADVCAVLAAALCAAALTGRTSSLVAVALLAPLVAGVAALHGLYDDDDTKLWHLTSDEVPRIFYAVSFGLGGGLVALSALNLEHLDASSGVVVWSLAFGTAVVGRFAVRFVWRRTAPPERGLVLGSGNAVDLIFRKLSLESGHHLKVVHRVDASGDDFHPPLAEVLERQDIDRVVLAIDELRDDLVNEVHHVCRQTGTRLSVVSPYATLTSPSAQYSQIAELPVLDFAHREPARHTLVLKRTLDVVGSGLALIVLAPLFAAIALIMKIEEPSGPVFFKQKRAGKDMEPFPMFKFRSMCVDAEEKLKELLDLENLGDTPMFKFEKDPRITRIGGFLRATSIDELPQLINVFLGHMSLVGPRPEEHRLVVQWPAEAQERLRVKPGLTGPMQIHGRGALDFDERVAIETHYLDHYSFRQDIRILARTVVAVFKGSGAY